MAEPILWAHAAESARKIPAKKFNPATGQVEQQFDPETGEPLFEKIPQRAHDGDSDYKKPALIRGVTWIEYLRHDGHVVRVKLTNGAAHLDTDTNYAKEKLAKARFFGWIRKGHCPLALVDMGEIKVNHIASESVRDGKRCAAGSFGEAKWCEHYIAEEAARKVRRQKAQAKRDLQTESAEQKLLRGQQEQTKEIVQGLADALRGAGAGKAK